MVIFLKTIFSIVLFLVIMRVYFLLLEQQSLYHPRANIEQTPSEYKIPYEEVEIETDDGQRLYGWYIPASGAQVTIMYFHGNAGNISDRLHKVSFFHELGVNFLIVDYRGYGRSTGKPSEKGFYLDAKAQYDYLVARKHLKPDAIVAYGKSLGVGVAIELAVREKIRSLILEGGFDSVVSVAQDIYPFLPVRFIVSQNYDNARKISRITVPKLIVHGLQDDVMPIKYGKRLFDAAAAPKQFLAFPGGHNEDIYVVSEEYKQKLRSFLGMSQ